MKPTTATLFDVLQAPEAKDLHPSDKLLMLYLKWRQGQNHAAWPGVDRIAADLGMDERQCRRSIERLCAADCISKTPGCRGRGNSNHYAVLLEKRGRIVPISEAPKGGVLSAFDSKKRGRIVRKKGAYCPMKEQGSNKKSTRRTAQTSFTPPGPLEVSDYANTRGVPDFDGQHFVDYYTRLDWHYKGGEPVKDWQAAVRTWIKRDNERRAKQGEPPLDGYSQFGTHPATEEEIAALREAGVL